ncbi:hypothetical protein LguiA_013870 [Lonicera macranthoides]
METIKKQRRKRQTRPMDDKSRKLVYNNRTKGIKKKTMELSTLCDIKACTIILSPDGNVDTWPENQSEVKAIIDNYRDYNKENKNGHKRARIEEGILLRKKFPKRSSDDQFISGLSGDSLKEFLNKIESKIECVKRRVEFLKMEKNRGINQEIERATIPSIIIDHHQNDQCLFDPTNSNNLFIQDSNFTEGLFNSVQTNFNGFSEESFNSAQTNFNGSSEELFNLAETNFNGFPNEYNQTLDLPFINESEEYFFNPPEFSFDQLNEEFNQTVGGIPNNMPFDDNESVFAAELPSLLYYDSNGAFWDYSGQPIF